MIQPRMCARRSWRPQPGMRRACRALSRLGIFAVVCGILGGPLGCSSFDRRPKVVAVPGDNVPHKISRGEVSEYDGWILPTPLFNRLTPCFKDVLEHPETEAGAPGHTMDLRP